MLRPSRWGARGEWSRDAIVASWQRDDQQATDLNMVAGLAAEIAEREEKLGIVASRLLDSGDVGGGSDKLHWYPS